MSAHNLLFFGILFFIFGIFLASFGFNFSALSIIASSAIILFPLVFIITKDKKYLCLSALSVFIFGGIFYFNSFDEPPKGVLLDYGKNSKFEARVVKVLSSGDKTISFAAEIGSKIKILINLPKYPGFFYGDVISFKGKIDKVENDSYGRYLLKEGISGTVNFPEVLGVRKSTGGFKYYLMEFKKGITDFLSGVLPENEGSFLSGLILGEKEGFSQEFKNEMKKSGTTHLVALSGYNVSLLVLGTLFIFSFLLPRLPSLIMASGVIIIFVVMTGAESSVVRAAIIGFLMFAAEESGRFFDPKNVIMTAALVMLLVNPRLLLFDVGFELSFLAFLGIVYLKPAFSYGFKFFDEPGFMNWRNNLISTFSAQVMVLPILWASFGYVSPLSLLANAFIAGLIPLTMALGFGVVGLNFLSGNLGILGSWIIFPLLKLETAIIQFFGNINMGFSVNFGWIASAAYYSVILFFILWRKKKCRESL